MVCGFNPFQSQVTGYIAYIALPGLTGPFGKSIHRSRGACEENQTNHADPTGRTRRETTKTVADGQNQIIPCKNPYIQEIVFLGFMLRQYIF